MICELENDNIKGMALVNQHEMPITNIKIFHNMKTPELFGKICSLEGYNMFSVKTLDDVYKIALLALEFNFM